MKINIDTGEDFCGCDDCIKTLSEKFGKQLLTGCMGGIFAVGYGEVEWKIGDDE